MKKLFISGAIIALAAVLIVPCAVSASSGTIAISSISPQSGVAGSQITVEGTGLSGVTAISFESDDIQQPPDNWAVFHVINDSALTVTVPDFGSGSENFTIIFSGSSMLQAFDPFHYQGWQSHTWDVTGDGICDVRDLGAVGSHVGQTGAPGWIPADVNQDGIIDVRDLGAIGSHVGQTWSLANNINYYTVNNGNTPFTRSSTPINLSSGNGSILQTVTSSGAAALLIANVTGYADCGFYFYAGQLKNLNRILVQSVAGSGSFGLNLWFDVDGDGEYFNWNNNFLTNLGGDSYILGPSSQNGTLTVSSNSQFSSLLPSGGNFTLAQLKNGVAPGITGDTFVAVWVGITVGNGGSLDATISSVSVQ